MFNEFHYVPILKVKRAELNAPAHIPQTIKSKLTPLLDIARPDLSSKNTKTLESHLQYWGDEIKCTWGQDMPLFIDLMYIPLNEKTSNNLHPAHALFNILRFKAIKAIPTTSLDRDSEYNKAVSNIIEKDRRGVLIRLHEDDMISASRLHELLNDTLRTLNVTKSNAHLLPDFGSLIEKDDREILVTAINIIDELPDIEIWQTLTFAGSGMPLTKQLSSYVNEEGKGAILRREFSIWKSLLNFERPLKRIPAFGDYTVLHPFHGLYKKGMSYAPTIRHTSDEQWNIHRGKGILHHPDKGGQYYTLSKTLVESNEFQNASYSYGDQFIDKKSNRIGGPGNPQQWLGAGINHHITYVIDQILRLAA